ncbi:MAG: hypothetical protein JNL98_11265 [Bryobacterales bacterium]|nr:hypothetical protein [Bryobacterales bacterium]
MIFLIELILTPFAIAAVAWLVTEFPTRLSAALKRVQGRVPAQRSSRRAAGYVV